MEPGKTPSYSASLTRRLTRLQTMYNVLKLARHDEIMSKNQFTGTETQLQRNRKFCQFNKDQYCIVFGLMYDKILIFNRNKNCYKIQITHFLTKKLKQKDIQCVYPQNQIYLYDFPCATPGSPYSMSPES